MWPSKIALWLACGAGLAQGEITATTHGVKMEFNWRAEPSHPDFDNSGSGVNMKPDVVKRHIALRKSHKYFGYDLTAEPLADGRYRLTFSGLSMTPEEMKKMFKGEWTLVPMPPQASTQVVSVGDVVALDLFVNPATGHKVVDYIRILSRATSNLASTAPARDLGVDEVEWTIEAPKVRVNSALVDQSGATIVGAPAWIYLKGHGRFVFSLRPRPELGFQKAGELRGSLMTWSAQGNQYVLEAARNVLPADGVFHLYVYHSPAYRPAKESSLEFGAGGTIEALVRR